MLIFGDFFSVHWGYIAFTDFSSSGKTKTKKSKLGQLLLKMLNNENCKKWKGKRSSTYPEIRLLLSTFILVGPGALKLDFVPKSRFAVQESSKMLLHDTWMVLGDPY